VGGWVRNRLDGSVEALVSGDEAAVTALQTWAYRGPSAAVVREVRATRLDATAIGDLDADDLPGPTCLQRPTA
jgi:acylphosphatase